MNLERYISSPFSLFADVQFEENAHGGASAIGTFVSSESKVRGFHCLVKGEGTFCNLHLERREWDVEVQFEENAHGGASANETFVSSESKVKGFHCLVKGEGTFCNLHLEEGCRT